MKELAATKQTLAIRGRELDDGERRSSDDYRRSGVDEGCRGTGAVAKLPSSSERTWPLRGWHRPCNGLRGKETRRGKRVWKVVDIDEGSSTHSVSIRNVRGRFLEVVVGGG